MGEALGSLSSTEKKNVLTWSRPGAEKGSDHSKGNSQRQPQSLGSCQHQDQSRVGRKRVEGDG